jgi:hypothetical protein
MWDLSRNGSLKADDRGRTTEGGELRKEGENEKQDAQELRWCCAAFGRNWVFVNHERHETHEKKKTACHGVAEGEDGKQESRKLLRMCVLRERMEVV